MYNEVLSSTEIIKYNTHNLLTILRNIFFFEKGVIIILLINLYVMRCQYTMEKLTNDKKMGYQCPMKQLFHN